MDIFLVSFDTSSGHLTGVKYDSRCDEVHVVPEQLAVAIVRREVSPEADEGDNKGNSTECAPLVRG